MDSKKPKRLTALVLALMLIISLTACTGGGGDDNQPNNTQDGNNNTHGASQGGEGMPLDNGNIGVSEPAEQPNGDGFTPYNLRWLEDEPYSVAFDVQTTDAVEYTVEILIDRGHGDGLTNIGLSFGIGFMYDGAIVSTYYTVPLSIDGVRITADISQFINTTAEYAFTVTATTWSEDGWPTAGEPRTSPTKAVTFMPGSVFDSSNGDGYTAYNLRWADGDNGIIAFDRQTIDAGIDYSVSLYRDGNYVDGVWLRVEDYITTEGMTVTAFIDRYRYMRDYWGEYYYVIQTLQVDNTGGGNHAGVQSRSPMHRMGPEPEPFTPPTPAEPGERGNTAGNIRYGNGYAAIKGDWVYFHAYGVLYKMRTDGSDLQEIDTGIPVKGQIFIIGDWIYTAHRYKLYRFRTDGTGLTEIPLTEANRANVINIAGDWIYYYFYGDGEAFNVYKIRTDGTEDMFLFETENPAFVDVTDDWIFYYNAGGGSVNDPYLTELKRARTDGSAVESMTIPSGWGANREQMNGDWLYFRDGNLFLNRMNTDTLERETIYDEYEVNSYVVDGDWIYFDAFQYSGNNNINQHHIYKIKTDGTGLTKVIDEYAIDVNVAGDWIFFRNDRTVTGVSAYYRIRTDGTGRKLVARHEPD